MPYKTTSASSGVVERLQPRKDPMDDPAVRVLAQRGLVSKGGGDVVMRGVIEVPLADGIQVSVGDNVDFSEEVDIHKVIISAMNDTTEDSDVDFGQLNSGGRKRLRDAYERLKLEKGTELQFRKLAIDSGLIEGERVPVSTEGFSYHSSKRRVGIRPVSKVEQTSWRGKKKKGKKK
jgi:hypothetical protein